MGEIINHLRECEAQLLFTNHRNGTWIPGGSNPGGLISPTSRPFIKAQVPATAENMRKPAAKTMRNGIHWEIRAWRGLSHPMCLGLGGTMGERPISRLPDRDEVPQLLTEAISEWVSQVNERLMRVTEATQLMCSWKGWTSQTLLYMASLHLRHERLFLNFYNPTRSNSNATVAVFPHCHSISAIFPKFRQSAIAVAGVSRT